MIFSLSVFVVTTFLAQGVPPQTANGLRRSTELTFPKEPAKALSPEVRGDILMARKMYREAVDMYKQSPQDSAIIANKTGIAHHQLLELEQAKKYYERAIKLNPQRSEEHTSELQSPDHLVCRLLLEKKKKQTKFTKTTDSRHNV